MTRSNGIIAVHCRVEVFEQAGGEIAAVTSGWCFDGCVEHSVILAFVPCDVAKIPSRKVRRQRQTGLKKENEGLTESWTSQKTIAKCTRKNRKKLRWKRNTIYFVNSGRFFCLLQKDGVYYYGIKTLPKSKV